MTLLELNEYFNSILKSENYSCDIALNGIQIQNFAPAEKQIKKVAFAVDACKETAARAKKIGADVLFVHHGLFWGQCQTITESFYGRVSEFIKNDIALIAYHIPLDANKLCGNNYGMAKKIGLKKLEEFGTWRGMSLGVKGVLSKPLSVQELSELLLDDKKPLAMFDFGKEKIKTVGIISGGTGEDVDQAVRENLDCYICGDFAHETFHFVKENKINVIAGGHYQTETFGVTLLMKKLQKEKKLEVEFIDCPTNL